MRYETEGVPVKVLGMILSEVLSLNLNGRVVWAW